MRLLLTTTTIIGLLLMSACTSIQVQPVARDINLSHVCIIENPAVEVANFLPVVKARFTHHGISTEVVTDKSQNTCEFILTYTALRSWDVALYLSHAELNLEDKSGRQIAHAEYHIGGGNWNPSLTKWKGTKTKMDPVIDRLLEAY